MTTTPPIKADNGGLRYDAGKPRTDLLPGDALTELGKVYAAGAVKYGERNWERGMPWSKVLGPLTRHLFRWMIGQPCDPETRLSHMTHVAWNALALVTYELRGIGTDDVHLAPRATDPYDDHVFPLFAVILVALMVILALVYGYQIGRLTGGA